MAEKVIHYPTTGVNFAGEHVGPRHVITMIDPKKDLTWRNINGHIKTDGVHENDNIRRANNTPEAFSEGVKILKGDYLIRAIEKHQMDHAVLFCRTRLDCKNLKNYLMQVGGHKYSCVYLHGGLKFYERNANLKKFTKKEVKFLICTDRILKIAGFPFVVNVTLPDSKSIYVDRIGRVERTGLVTSFVATVPEKVWYHGDWCQKQGFNCWNTNLTNENGCCMWYNEITLYNSYTRSSSHLI